MNFSRGTKDITSVAVHPEIACFLPFGDMLEEERD